MSKTFINLSTRITGWNSQLKKYCKVALFCAVSANTCASSALPSNVRSSPLIHGLFWLVDAGVPCSTNQWAWMKRSTWLHAHQHVVDFCLTEVWPNPKCKTNIRIFFRFLCPNLRGGGVGGDGGLPVWTKSQLFESFPFTAVKPATQIKEAVKCKTDFNR